MKLEKLLDNESQFTELVRITDFTTVSECVDAVNKYYGLENEDPMDKYHTEDTDEAKYNYLYVSGDGFIYFVSDLNEFDEGYRSEQEWGVVSSEPMN